MLFKIDTMLIAGAQWTMQQIELFTEKKNKDVGIFLTLLNLYFSMFTVFSFIITMDTKNISDGLVIWSILFLQYITHTGLMKRVKFPVMENIYPQEIKSRRIYRILLIFYCAYFGFRIVATIIFYVGNNVPLMGIRGLLGTIILLTILTPLLAEYFLCTTPLSPEEKEEKRKRFMSVSHE